MDEFISKNLVETAKIASNFALTTLVKHNFEGKAAVVGLYGELGSGKTTFMKYLAESFGIKEIIQSPTFVIEKIYDLTGQPFQHLIHIDAYRIEKEEEMLNLGWSEIIADPQNLICIEWADRIAKIMPKHIMITFEHVSETKRRIIINDNG
jgi:tRNA threonylcarbamoyladenosine biosynthesis protein TsaE